mmetsp:Transcript_21463/g.67992  ORF Transcript_21463/g.67992 Transcript_21463/m.67992 type:complete len:214 (+) Transcript_21463:1259-1900(+)
MAACVAALTGAATAVLGALAFALPRALLAVVSGSTPCRRSSPRPTDLPSMSTQRPSTPLGIVMSGRHSSTQSWSSLSHGSPSMTILEPRKPSPFLAAPIILAFVDGPPRTATRSKMTSYQAEPFQLAFGALAAAGTAGPPMVGFMPGKPGPWPATSVPMTWKSQMLKPKAVARVWPNMRTQRAWLPSPRPVTTQPSWPVSCARLLKLAPSMLA